MPMQYLLTLIGFTLCRSRMSCISLHSHPSCFSSMMTASPMSAMAPVLKFRNETDKSMVRRSLKPLFTNVMRRNDVSSDGDMDFAS